MKPISGVKYTFNSHYKGSFNTKTKGEIGTLINSRSKVVGPYT